MSPIDYRHIYCFYNPRTGFYMKLQPSKSHSKNGFTLAEVVVALLVAAIFGAATFATNQRLMEALKSQRETACVSMML